MRLGVAYPGLPRRDRRGVSALSMVMMLAALMTPMILSWQIALAEARMRGQAQYLAQAVAAQGYGLHHWLHAARTATPPEIATPTPPRRLSAAERRALATHRATAGWRRAPEDPTRVLLPRGWQIIPLVGSAGGDLPDGVVVLRASDEVATHPIWPGLNRALDRALDLLLEEGDGSALSIASTALGDFDPDRDRAMLASRTARLDSTAVLRERHAGHPRTTMATDINLGGHEVLNVNRFEAQTGVLPEMTGSGITGIGGVLRTGPLEAQAGFVVAGSAAAGTLTADTTTLAGQGTGIDRIKAGTVTARGTLSTPDLTACATPGADLCGGGALDLRAATGTPDWTRATVFGDVVIRDGNRLVGVTTTHATTGIFNQVGPAPVLDVEGCFRSVTPFVHGAGC